MLLLELDKISREISDQKLDNGVFPDNVFTNVQVFPLNEKIEHINDQYWRLRAEEVCLISDIFFSLSWFVLCSCLMLSYVQIPEDQQQLNVNSRLIHVYHFTWDASQTQMVFHSCHFFLVIAASYQAYF